MRSITVLLLLFVALPAVADAARCEAMAATEPVILVVGDSLSAGYGIDLDEGWVALLQERLDNEDYGYQVINASVSGDTTAGGRTRLAKALPKHKPRLVVIELGGNDGLRGLPLKVVEQNFDTMIRSSQASGAAVALLGMRIPTNYGRRYAEKFHEMYATLAQRHTLPLVDFFLDGVALEARMMQQDGIHPNAAAQVRLLENAWGAIGKALALCD